MISPPFLVCEARVGLILRIAILLSGPPSLLLMRNHDLIDLGQSFTADFAALKIEKARDMLAQCGKLSGFDSGAPTARSLRSSFWLVFAPLKRTVRCTSDPGGRNTIARRTMWA